MDLPSALDFACHLQVQANNLILGSEWTSVVSDRRKPDQRIPPDPGFRRKVKSLAELCNHRDLQAIEQRARSSQEGSLLVNKARILSLV